MLGTQDLLLGAVIAFFLFGAKRLPELMGSIGKSVREFKKGIGRECRARGRFPDDESCDPRRCPARIESPLHPVGRAPDGLQEREHV